MLWEKHRFVLYDMNGTIEIMNRKDFSQLCPKHSDLSESNKTPSETEVDTCHHFLLAPQKYKSVFYHDQLHVCMPRNKS